MDRNNRQDSAVFSLNMKKYLFPLMTLLVLGQMVYLFTAFDVTGATGDLLERLSLTLR
ncbi:MAG: hypothetical protein HYV23_02075 [Deltaproteobacteria bacterium]|nr:hypothetical protein [Deltaproteobacteria bacterium]